MLILEPKLMKYTYIADTVHFQKHLFKFNCQI